MFVNFVLLIYFISLLFESIYYQNCCHCQTSSSLSLDPIAISQMVQLDIVSPVFLFEDIELECRYKLDNKKLYSIKWYKNDKEFMQYVPHEKPNVQYFSSKGIQFDSPAYEIFNNTFKLWLKSVSLDSQGIYRCELSTDAPDFTTYKDYKPLEVYVLPIKSPRISGNKANFLLKSRIDLNCTSPKSKPATTLQWFINDKLAPSDYLIYYPKMNHSDGLQSKILRLKFIVNDEYFRFGNMKLKCVAIYKKLTLDTNETIIRRHWKLYRKKIAAKPKTKPNQLPNEITDSDIGNGSFGGSLAIHSLIIITMTIVMISIVYS